MKLVATQIEREARINAIAELLAQGYSGYTLQRMVEQTFGISKQQAGYDITTARQAMREALQIDRADLAVQLLAMHQEVFVAAMAARQYSAAVGALASISRLTGVEAPRA